jgi:CRISPR-associated protein Csb1
MIDYSTLQNAPRLLMEAELKPLQGERFQPTGYADLGPARYTVPGRTESDPPTAMLLVESAQSIANRMELACCQDDGRTLLDELRDLPYVVGLHKGEVLTRSYLEAHRLSSPYLLNKDWAATLAKEMGLRDDYQLNHKQVFAALFKYDPCSLLHGVWLSLEKYKNQFSGGRVRVTRTLSGFIEARNVEIAENGGTKFDRNSARTDEEANAKTGYGTLPFQRTEFTAGEIKVFFNLDLALLRGYGLPDSATELLIALALFKIRRFLIHGLRLRTACDLQLIGDLLTKRPEGFTVPDGAALLEECRALIAKCKGAKLFAEPAATRVSWEPEKKGKAEPRAEDQSDNE